VSESSALRLDPKDIRYLALEGGGGKGFAYIGALQLLEEQGVLAQIQGVGGASAGAITALMISLGMSASEMATELNSGAFASFFDDPEPRVMPAPLPSDYQPVATSLAERALLTAGEQDRPRPLAGVDCLDRRAPLLRGYAAIDEAETNFASGFLKPPFATIVKNFQKYFTYLDRDMGLFSGQAARTYFDNLIAKQADAIAGTGISDPAHHGMTFEQHKAIFGKELLVCGANFSTGKTVLFSPRPEHTPQFPVADAIRISMSLPLIFKPYVITQSQDGYPGCGTYVDGGFWNNIPLREIEPIPAATMSSSIPVAQRWPKETLALRLQIDPATKVRSALDVGAVMASGIIGSGESQVIQDLQWASVVLDTRDLSLLDFSPDPAVAEKVRKRSRRAVSRYFGWSIKSEDFDAADDQETNKLLAQTACDM
jgi:predicted acylesterase/phospholipase RssA